MPTGGNEKPPAAEPLWREGGWTGVGRLRVEVIPLGAVDEVSVSVVAANIQTFIGLPVDVAPPWPDPAYALIPVRGQYNALPILKALGAGLEPGIRRIGLLAGDLCLPILTYVFGEAQVNGRAAVVSLRRLKLGRDGQRAPAHLALERLAKVAVHEMSHVLGLTHCRSPRCLMSFSLGIEQLDALTLRFCPECERLVARRIPR
jgi:archaemetzincin